MVFLVGKTSFDCEICSFLVLTMANLKKKINCFKCQREFTQPRSLEVQQKTCELNHVEKRFAKVLLISNFKNFLYQKYPENTGLISAKHQI